jgi:hypothetical protein
MLASEQNRNQQTRHLQIRSVRLTYLNITSLPDQCKRVNIGGKLLTNYLKEVVSYRQWNMMDEFKLMEQVM